MTCQNLGEPALGTGHCSTDELQNSDPNKRIGWIHVAIVMDHFLFWVFLVLLILTSFVTLIVIPAAQKTSHSS